jgi:dTDP-4-amino-4,6-dideoxygalactose transaminase
MLRTVPVVALPIGLNDLVYGLGHAACPRQMLRFELAMGQACGCRHVCTADSGTTSFYLGLLALKKVSGRTEVILPAYTAQTLVTAVLAAGLKPVLCDITLDDFNLDIQSLLSSVTSRTLAAVCVHMFGIPVARTAELKQQLPPDVFLIEDCCQALGSQIQSQPAGSWGDLSFFSFNRGKNIPLFGGGCLATNSDRLRQSVEQIVAANPRRSGWIQEMRVLTGLIGLAVAVRPRMYGLLYPLLSRLRQQPAPQQVRVGAMSGVQAGTGEALLRKLPFFSAQRQSRVHDLLAGLSGCSGLRLPRIQTRLLPACNRLPVLFEQPDRRAVVMRALLGQGIEASLMYLQPLHRAFDLGYKADAFPASTYAAEHLLTLPVHPLVSGEDMRRMIDTIKAR